MSDLPSSQGAAPPAVRTAALELLLECEATRRFADELLAPRLPAYPARDRHLLQEIVYGTLRHRNTLDRIVKPHVKLPVPRQRPPVAWALRLGTYQLVYLSRIPPHAAVGETVEALKHVAGATRKDGGFVNAVLHRVSSDIHRKSSIPPEDPRDPSAIPIRKGWCFFKRPVLPLYRLHPHEHLAVKYSHPVWLVRRWVRRFGEEETERLLEANNRTPAVTARVSRFAPSREALIAELEREGFTVEAAGEPGVIIVRGGGDLSTSEAWRRGWFQVQDVTAMRPAAVLAPPRGARVLDLCSAPGGKAFQLLEAAGEEGFLVACDRSEEKLALVRENLERIGRNFELRVVPDDPDRIDLGEEFTHVLVDAPCSNTGVLARRPEARWRLKEGDLESLVRLQRGLLEAGVRHLARGGRLVYATCSLEPEENEERVAEAVRRHEDLVELESRLLLPHRTGGDGGYYSLLSRRA